MPPPVLFNSLNRLSWRFNRSIMIEPYNHAQPRSLSEKPVFSEKTGFWATIFSGNYQLSDSLLVKEELCLANQFVWD